MTERGLAIADGAAACPFVAFEDERDERSSVPDHRHRCYAETPPAPRAIAHQEAYCLSTAFPVCPVFQDWARREAARTRGSRGGAEATSAAPAAGVAGGADAAGTMSVGRAVDGTDDSDGGDVVQGLAVDRSDAHDAASRFDEAGSADDREASDDPDAGPRSRPAMPGTEPETARRNPPRDWAAPPPWLASAEGHVGDGDEEGEPPGFLGRRTQDPGQGLAGSAADRLAGGGPPPGRQSDSDRWSPSSDADQVRSAAIAAAAAAGASAAASTARADRTQAQPEEPVDWDGDPSEPPQRRITRRPRAYAQHLGGPDDGPDWERPRRYEAYPTIRTRVGMPQVPRIAVMAAAIVVLAIALFLLPGLLNIGGTGTGAPGASASAPTASRAASRAPTVAPAPTATVYTIKKNETLSKIAARYGLTLQELLAANPDIKNPNKVGEGQQIIIPTASGGPVSGAGTGSPSAAAS